MQNSARVDYESALDDGRRVLFRPIEPSDKQRLADGFERLSPQSRYRRFFRAIDHLSEDQLRYLTEVDMESHVAWLAVLPDEPGQPAIGVGRWVRIAAEPDIAEGAVTVGDDYQHRGIGKALLWLMARSAIERGVRAFRVWALGDNRPVIEMLRDAGAPMGEWQSGVMEVTVPLPETVDELERTPAPKILRAAAGGRLEGEAKPGVGTTHLLRHPED